MNRGTRLFRYARKSCRFAAHGGPSSMGQQNPYIPAGFRTPRVRGLHVSRNIIVEELIHTPIEEQETEIVERKGIGHPDSVADGLAESVSRALCKMYLEKYDRILHHNTRSE